MLQLNAGEGVQIVGEERSFWLGYDAVQTKQNDHT
jgi:hypothetical protein